MELVRIVESKNKMHEKPGHQNGREGKAEEHYRFGALALPKPESCAPIATIIAAEARIVRIRIALLLSSSRLACCLMPSISHRNIMTPEARCKASPPRSKRPKFGSSHHQAAPRQQPGRRRSTPQASGCVPTIVLRHGDVLLRAATYFLLSASSYVRSAAGRSTNV